MDRSAKVGVLMGGPSEEHEISLKSGWGVAEALRMRGWNVEPILIPNAFSLDEAHGAVGHALKARRVDVAFIALHGTFGEDGTVQEICETAGVPYTGSDVAASRLGMDKVASRQRFREAGLAVPQWQVVETAKWEGGDGASSLWYPVVVKPINQGSSVGVSLVRREAALPSAIREAGRFGPQALIEEYIEGRELTVGVLGQEPLPIVEIRPREPFFSYTAKYTTGRTEYLAPAPLPVHVAHAVQAASLTAHHALGCRHVSRVDLMLTGDETPVILEVNTIPGLTPMSLLPKAAACVNLSYEELCEWLVLMALDASVAQWPSGPVVGHSSPITYH
jgi:D-alanine-D-alanine ligase